MARKILVQSSSGLDSPSCHCNAHRAQSMPIYSYDSAHCSHYSNSSNGRVQTVYSPTPRNTGIQSPLPGLIVLENSQQSTTLSQGLRAHSHHATQCFSSPVVHERSPVNKSGELSSHSRSSHFSFEFDEIFNNDSGAFTSTPGHCSRIHSHFIDEEDEYQGGRRHSKAVHSSLSDSRDPFSPLSDSLFQVTTSSSLYSPTRNTFSTSNAITDCSSSFAAASVSSSFSNSGTLAHRRNRRIPFLHLSRRAADTDLTTYSPFSPNKSSTNSSASNCHLFDTHSHSQLMMSNRHIFSPNPHHRSYGLGKRQGNSSRNSLRQSTSNLMQFNEYEMCLEEHPLESCYEDKVNFSSEQSQNKRGDVETHVNSGSKMRDEVPTTADEMSEGGEMFLDFIENEKESGKRSRNQDIYNNEVVVGDISIDGDIKPYEDRKRMKEYRRMNRRRETCSLLSPHEIFPPSNSAPALRSKRRASLNSSISNQHPIEMCNDMKDVAERFGKSRQREWVRIAADQVDIQNLGFSSFRFMLNQLFRGGRITRERILVLFFFCSDLTLRLAKYHLIKLVSNITSWTLNFINTRLNTLVLREGGWRQVFQTTLSITQQLAWTAMCLSVITACLVYIKKNF